MTRRELIGKYKNVRHYLESVGEVVKNGYPAKKLIVVGVTGTDGKTTTCHLIYEILKAAGKKVALVSTVAAYIGDEEIDTGFHVTTPDAKFLQPLIKRIVGAGMEYLVLETTSHGLDQHRVLGCNYYIGVLTNITHEHLDYHKTFEKYREAKAKLFRRAKYAVLNKDDPSFGYIKNLTHGKVVAYGKAGIKKVNQTLLGEYNQYNLGASLAVARILGIGRKVVEAVAGVFAGIPGRRDEISLGQKFRAMVDFAHTPNALSLLLKQLRKELPTGKKLILVFGCAGLRDVAKRSMMGKIARKRADVAIVTAEDPRTEKLDDIYNQIISGITPLNPPLKLRGGNPKGEGDIVREDDRQKAINVAVKLARVGDMVVVTGKGHERSMCFGIVEQPWSDVEAVKRALRLVE